MKPEAYMPSDKQLDRHRNLMLYANANRTTTMRRDLMTVHFPDGGWMSIDQYGMTVASRGFPSATRDTL